MQILTKPIFQALFWLVSFTVNTLNGLEVGVCENQNSNCLSCGTIQNADGNWNYIICKKEISGSWIHLEFNVPEIHIYIVKLSFITLQVDDEYKKTLRIEKSGFQDICYILHYAAKLNIILEILCTMVATAVETFDGL